MKAGNLGTAEGLKQFPMDRLTLWQQVVSSSAHDYRPGIGG